VQLYITTRVGILVLIHIKNQLFAGLTCVALLCGIKEALDLPGEISTLVGYG